VATVAPGLKGTAPTRTSGAVPGSASDETTLWLASVPMLHGVLRETGANPAARKAAWAAAIFNPITFGTVLCGRVVGGAVIAVDVVAAAVVVVVLGMPRTAFFGAAVGELPPHDVRRHAATRAAVPRAATRPPTCTAPSLFVDRLRAASTRPAPVISRC
jgi:hypothetical protein